MLPLIHPLAGSAQCPSNLGFDNGNFTGWTTSTDSLFIQPANRVYSKPGINQKVVAYGSTDQWLGTIKKPNSTVGSYLVRVGNKGVKAVADTVYRKYVIDSVSDKLTIYSIGVSELAHNYWGVPTVEAPGFGYEIYINGKKLDCLKGSFFCGNQDTPAVWQIGQYKDTATVRRSSAWAEEVLNFACYRGDTVEIRLFTRDCILLGHYAYAYFDVQCGDTTPPVITKIMVEDIIDADQLNLYCTDSGALSLAPNTDICPIFRTNIKWTPSVYIYGPDSIADAKLHNINVDSVWVYAAAKFTNFCTTLDIKDSILVVKHNYDPHDNLPKLPRNFCDCYPDSIDFGTASITTIKDENGNTMTLDNGKLYIQPCDQFYVETSWKNPSTKIRTNNSKIFTAGWSGGDIEGAIGTDSILATGRVKFEVLNAAGKRFFTGLTQNNANNNNDLDFAILFNAGTITAYYKGTSLSSLGNYTGYITIEFVTLSNRKVEIWINGTRKYTYSNSQKANFPIFPDFSARSNDSNHINKVSIFGPTTHVKDFTKLLQTKIFHYYLTYTDRCGTLSRDTIQMIPGFEASLFPTIGSQCGLAPITIKAHSSSIIDHVWPTTDGDGTFTTTDSAAIYLPVSTDPSHNPIHVYMTSQSGRCTDDDTASFIIYDKPRADAGPDISTTLDTFMIGGSPSGTCPYCLGHMQYDWNRGNQMTDSTIANPSVIKSKLTGTTFILKVKDSITGCFSMDTAEIYISLSRNEVLIKSHCINNEQLEFRWAVLPDNDHFMYGIEYSDDGGRTWIKAGSVLADRQSDGTMPVQYMLSLAKPEGSNVLYRWYTANIKGEKLNIVAITDINCDLGTIYTLHPNPFKDVLKLNVESTSVLKPSYTVQVYNQYGQLIIEQTFDNRSSDGFGEFMISGLENYAKGIYYVTISSQQNTLHSAVLVKAE